MTRCSIPKDDLPLPPTDGLEPAPGPSRLCLLTAASKTEDGRATSAQLQAIEDLRAAGAHAEVCRSLDAAIKQLEDWQLLRGRTQ